MHPGRAISRQQLAFAFWPDTSDDRARGNLRNLLHRLRDALPAGARWLSFDRHTGHWQPDLAIRLDVAEFEAALARARAAGQTGDRDAEGRALREALAPYTGDLLPDCYDDWIAPIRERLSQAALRAQLDDERFRAAWTLGCALTTERAVELALELLASG